MHLLNKYLPRTEFDSYEDLKKNYRVIVPEGFNGKFADYNLFENGLD